MDSSSPGTGATSVPTRVSVVGVDEVKRLQSVLHDLSKRLDDSLPKCRHVVDLFSPELNFFRVKLQDYATRLFAADPVKHGTAAMDVSWRKGIYDTLAMARSIKQGWTPMERSYVQSHLINGMGHFEHLLLLAVEEMGGNNKVLDKLGWIQVDFVTGKSYGNSKQQIRGKSNAYHHDSDTVSAWIKQTVHRCLMCLGDISRYMIDFSPEKAVMAERFYRQALMVDPVNGIPFNQLATLAGEDEYALSAAFYYLRSLTCQKPFDGGESNLKKLLERNNKAFLKFGSSNSSPSDLDVLSPRAETERCVVFLLEMTKVFVFEEVSGRNLPELCQKALQAVQHCLYLPVDDSKILLPDSVASKMVLVLLLAMEKVRHKESRLSMLRAYLLALFSHFVTKFLADLHLGLFGPESLLDLFEVKEAEKETNGDDVREEVRENGDVTAKVKKAKGLDRFKRRRRRGESSGEDSYDEETGSEDGSDDDASSDTSDESSLDDSIVDGNGDDGNGILDSDDVSEDDEDDVIIESSKEILSTLNLVKIVNNHPLNQAIRICSLWLMKSPAIVKEAGPTSEILWSRLTQLFTTLSLDNPDYEANDQVVESVAKCQKLLELQALQEDFSLRGLATFEKDLEKIEWNVTQDLDSCDLGVIRILHHMRLRDWLCSIRQVKVVENGNQDKVPDDKVVDRLDELNPGKLSGGKARNGLICLNRNGIDEDNAEKKKKEMENMAQLWLQQEVHDLEANGSRNQGTLRGFAHYSPYIVLDHFALSNHLHMVKEIVASKKFAVIIPSAVIQLLDEMKKSQSGARTAIRWLEKQFQDGNRWLRPQRKNEFKGLELMQYPKRKDKEAWHYFKIFECCNHFALVRGEELSKDRIQVTLLTANDNPIEDSTETDKEDPNREDKKPSFSPQGLAKMINIRVENIDNFLQQAAGGTSKRNDSRSKWKKNKQSSNG